jgi:hypothetical protein
MPRLAVHIKVDDFETWRASFDNDKAARDKTGLRDVRIYQNADDDCDVTVVGEADDPRKVIEAIRTPEWRKKMKDRGVEGDPQFFIAQPA